MEPVCGWRILMEHARPLARLMAGRMKGGEEG